MTASEMARLLSVPLTTGLEYVRSMTAAGHLDRSPHPLDGRARSLELNRAGRAAQARANRRWELVRKGIERRLGIPVAEVRRSLQALDDAAAAAGEEAVRVRRS
jgi:DNA-binding MarR family transcriptional regulator